MRKDKDETRETAAASESVNADAAVDQQGPASLGWAERWLSKARLVPYLKDCGGDVDIALELRVLCPEAHDYLFGDDSRTGVERFLADNPAPADVKL